MKIPLPDSLCPIQNAVGLAFFPVRKNCGEPDPRFAEIGATWQPSLRTEGLALR
jgi:hypothetical protein